MELEVQREDEERQEEEVTEELKQVMGSLSKEALCVFENKNAEHYMKAAAAVQNEFSAMASPMKRNKELPPRHHWIVFLRGSIELNPARNRNLSHQRQA